VRVSGGRLSGLVVLLGLLGGCGGRGPTVSEVVAPSGSAGTTGATGSGGASGVARGGCADLFDQGVLQTYSIDISADEWAKLDAEFHDVQAVLAAMPPETYHPVTFHFGSETVTDAAVRLKGQSSWVETVMFDANPKMQLVIAFDQVNAHGQFHGVDKIHLDMPRTDWSFLSERLSNNWFREIGIMAPCSNSARLNVNGSYYGLYVAEESKNSTLVQEFFPGNAGGDLFKGGSIAETNKLTADWTRLRQLWNANDIAGVEQIVDLPNSVLEWAAEAAINDADGYYGGSHNFYIYDQGARGYTWLPSDVDTTFAWTELFSSLSYKQHPIFWWEGQSLPQPPGQHYLIVMNDPTWRARYVQAVAAQVAKWNTTELLSWVDTWSAQIAAAVAEDPHRWATAAEFDMAIAATRDLITNRPVYLQSFVACEQGQGGEDKDGDGAAWCNDCQDDNPAVHPGAADVCGNGVDDNCDGVVDEGCTKP